MLDLLEEAEKDKKYVNFFESLKKEYRSKLDQAIKAGRDLYSNFDFFSSFGILIEPLQAFPTNELYYQYCFLDGVRMPINWSTTFNGLFFGKEGFAAIFTRSMVEDTRAFLKYYAIKVDPEIAYNKKEEVLKISFNGAVKLRNLTTGKDEEHNLQFAFVDATTQNSFLSFNEASRDSMLIKLKRYKTKPFLKSLSYDFIPSQHYLQPYWIINNYSNYGFSSRLELQKAFKGILLATFSSNGFSYSLL